MIEHFRRAEAQNREQIKAQKYSVKIDFFKLSPRSSGFRTSKGCGVDNTGSWGFAEKREMASKETCSSLHKAPAKVFFTPLK